MVSDKNEIIRMAEVGKIIILLKRVFNFSDSHYLICCYENTISIYVSGKINHLNKATQLFEKKIKEFQEL